MRRATILLFVFLLLPVVAAPQGTIIETVAGGGPNNLPALSANLDSPISVATDTVGNFYVITRSQYRVFKVDLLGQLTMVAGTGFVGFSGDGGPATSAQLDDPTGVAVDLNGNLFISERGNRVRRVDASTGTITTVAGNGASGFLGDGGPATSARLLSPSGVAVDHAGNLFIADSLNRRVRRVDAVSGIITTFAGGGSSLGDGGPATSASLIEPAGVAPDSQGNLYIADRFDRRVRRVDAATGVITTAAGNGLCCFNGDGGLGVNASLHEPVGVAVDSSGNVYIADRKNQRIRKLDGTTSTITTIAGNGFAGFGGDGGSGISASLQGPSGVAIDVDNNLLIADQDNLRIRLWDSSTTIITTAAGNGIFRVSDDGFFASGITLGNPVDVAKDSHDNLLIVDSLAHSIRLIDSSGITTRVAGNGVLGSGGDGGPAGSASLLDPVALAVGSDGRLCIAEFRIHKIRCVDPITQIINTFAGGGSGGLGDGGPATNGRLNFPRGMAFDAAGNLLIAEQFGHRIRRVDASTGIILTIAGNGIRGFGGDGGPASSASLNEPVDVAADSQGNLYIADQGNRRIRRVDATTGTISTVAGNGFGFSGDGGPATSAGFDWPSSVAVDPAGNLFVGDLASQRIRRVDGATGIITTFAGNGLFGFSGDGGPATSARLANPTGVAVDVHGNLFIADLNNQRIRRVGAALNQPPVADAGPDQVIECTWPTGTSVTIDGSGSSDPDGDPLIYEWRDASGSVLGTTASITPSLSFGAHTFTLTVDDGRGGVSSDSVQITVVLHVEGLLAPLATLVPEGNLPPLPGKAFKSGSTLPLKVQLSCGGLICTDQNVVPPQIVGLLRNGDALELATVDLDSGQSNDSGTLFRYSDPDWVFNLSTKGLTSGSYVLLIAMPDGQRYAAAFVLR